MRYIRYIIPIGIIVLALLGSSGIYVVGHGHAAALIRLGHVEATAIGPGLHFKLPFMERAALYDTRAIVLQSEPQDYKTSDGDSVRAGFFVRWQVADPAVYFHATSGDELQVTQQMTPLIRAALRAQIANHSMAELLASDGGPIDSGLRAAVSAKVRQKLGVNVLAVGVERVLPPDANLASVYKRMSTEANARAATVREEGAAAAAAIRAKGDTADQAVLATATRQAAVVRGQGDAEAAKIYAVAAAQNPQFFRYWSSLDTWRRSFAGGGAIVVLDRNSPLMQAVDAGATSGNAAPAKER
ncbi:MAG TPA: protease modulator HflC [Rhodanobacteraceae bacterium]